MIGADIKILFPFIYLEDLWWSQKEIKVCIIVIGLFEFKMLLMLSNRGVG